MGVPVEGHSKMAAVSELTLNLVSMHFYMEGYCQTEMGERVHLIGPPYLKAVLELLPGRDKVPTAKASHAPG